MAYDFTTVIDRAGKDALAYDFEEAMEAGSFGVKGVRVKEGFDIIPMWVADMNFATAPSVQRALKQRIEHPLYGYYSVRNEYYQAIIDWHRERHGVCGLAHENIGYENGVLGGVVSALNVLCSKGDNVLLHSPTYLGFTETLENNGYHIVLSPLVMDDQGVWRMDYADMERKIVENKINACVFCSPHNPTGRVWERSELEQAFAVFEKHGVRVVSDEIWADVLLDGHRHIPVQEVSEYAKMHTVALYAPSKTFNLAGLIGSYRIVYSPWLRNRLDKEASLSHYNEMNVLSMHALIGAYSPEGAAWLKELSEVLSENVSWACDFISQRWKGVSFGRPQGTYMLFIDCAEWCAAHGKTLEDVLAAGLECGVLWKDGRAFNAPCSIRINLALPKERLIEAFNRLDAHVFRA